MNHELLWLKKLCTMIVKLWHGGVRRQRDILLAAALVWANQEGMGHEFVCVDRRLWGAAQREGFSVLPREADIQKAR